MNIGSALLMGVLGAVVGAVGCWWLIGSYYHPEPTAREQALWKRIGELQSIMEVPPVFLAGLGTLYPRTLPKR